MHFFPCSHAFDHYVKLPSVECENVNIYYLVPRTFFRSLFIYVWTLHPIFPTPTLITWRAFVPGGLRNDDGGIFLADLKKNMPEVLFLGTNPKVVLVADNTSFSFCYIKDWSLFVNKHHSTMSFLLFSMNLRHGLMLPTGWNQQGVSLLPFLFTL